MRITVERSGGFMGRLVKGEVDTALLSAREAESLSQMVTAAHFFELPTDLPSETGADQFQYRVTVEQDAQNHTVQMTDMSAPDELRPLLQQVLMLGRSSGESSQ